MKNDPLNSIFQWMQDFALRAGRIALLHQKDAVDIGKPEYQGSSKEGSVKTIADDIIQELFLAELYKQFPEISINVEEDTPLTTLFKDKRFLPKPNKSAGSLSNYIIHLDPIDGTFTYISKKKEFSVGLALSDKNFNFTHSVIYSPAIKRIFTASPESFSIHDLDKRVIKYPQNQSSKVIYEKRIFSEQGRALVANLGFTVIRPPSAHLAIVYTALRKSAGFLYGGSNPHDGMIPAAFAKAVGVEPTNIYGKKLGKHSFRLFKKEDRYIKLHRIPSVCYLSCTDDKKKKIFEILSDKKNIDSEYLRRFAEYET